MKQRNRSRLFGEHFTKSCFSLSVSILCPQLTSKLHVYGSLSALSQGFWSHTMGRTENTEASDLAWTLLGVSRLLSWLRGSQWVSGRMAHVFHSLEVFSTLHSCPKGRWGVGDSSEHLGMYLSPKWVLESFQTFWSPTNSVLWPDMGTSLLSEETHFMLSAHRHEMTLWNGQ